MKSLFALAFLCSISARAAFGPAQCKEAGGKAFTAVFLEKGTGCDDLAKIEKVAARIQTFAELGTPLTLFVNAKAYEAYTSFGRLIVLNARQMAWGKVRPQAQTEKIWAHELGHAVFNQLLSEQFPPIRPYRDFMAEKTKLIVNAQDPELDTEKTLEPQWTAAMAKARDIQVPYNELFADLVAALYAEDSSAMSKAMASPGMPRKKQEETRYYDFTGKYDVEKWEEEEVHYFFAPARAHIGKHFLSWPMTDQRKREVLRKIFDACLAEIRKNWEGNQSLPSPSAANRRLIESLSRLRREAISRP